MAGRKHAETDMSKKASNPRPRKDVKKPALPPGPPPANRNNRKYVYIKVHEAVPQGVIDDAGVEWIAAPGLYIRLIEKHGNGVAYLSLAEDHTKERKPYPGGLKKDPRGREFTRGGNQVPVDYWRIRRELKACSIICPNYGWAGNGDGQDRKAKTRVRNGGIHRNET